MVVEVNKEKCIGCAGCVGICPALALSFHPEERIPVCGESCINCRKCVKFCPTGAIKVMGEKE